MNPKPRSACRRLLPFMVMYAVLSGCTPAPDSIPTTTQQTEHRIGVRTTAEGSEFFDAHTNERFVPRGPNLHRFGPEGEVFVDMMFAVGDYDAGWVDEQFEQIAALGYNSVRTSVDLCQLACIGSAAGGLDEAFLDNIALFIGQAKAHGLQVFLTSNDLPERGGFVPRVEATTSAQFDGYLNSHYFHPTGYAVYRDYWVAVVSGLVDRGAALDAVAGYQVRGELFQFENTPPLSLREGTVATANGKEYDLSSPAAREALLTEGTTFWLNSLRAAIREVDPTALVGVGMFAPNSPHRWLPEDDPRVIATDAVWASEVDFVDVHLYPGYIDIDQLAENLGMAPGSQVKPTLFGEFGAFTFVFGDARAAAGGLMAWQVAACSYGMNGWFHWHWRGTEDHEVWTGTDGGGLINTVLSPQERPDPCEAKAFDFLEANLARTAVLTASSAVPGQPPSRAADGQDSTAWQSGAGPPAWIQLDLAEPSLIRELRLVVDQFPAGRTVHRVLGSIDGSWKLLHTFDGGTSAGSMLSWRPEVSIADVDAVRIETLESPSFVSWFEVAIIG